VLGGDKSYDVAAFVEALREREVTPHIAVDGHVRKSGRPRKTAIDRRTTRHLGYAISQLVRHRIEEIFGWSKATGGIAQVKLRGLAKVRAGALHLRAGRLQPNPHSQTARRDRLPKPPHPAAASTPDRLHPP